MFNRRLELCDGIVASFDDEKNVYVCYVAWLGRDIEIWLSASDYDEYEIKSLKITFEKFWNERQSLLAASQNDIRERVIPYIAKERASNKYSIFSEVSVDDFDADYWLTSVYIVSDLEGDYGEIQMNFYKDGDEDNDGNFLVSRDLYSGNLTFYVDSFIVSDDI